MNSKTLGLALTAMAALTFTAPAHADYCREYTRNVSIGGKVEQAYGTACMQPDGSWQEVTEPQVEPTTTNFYPVTPQMQVAQPRIPYDYRVTTTTYTTPAPVYVTPAPVTRAVYRDRGSVFSISFGDDYRYDPYYAHGRYYNPWYWDKHWKYHEKYNRGWDRGRGQGHRGRD